MHVPSRPHPSDLDCALAVADHRAGLATIEERGGINPQIALDGAIKPVAVHRNKLSQNGRLEGHRGHSLVHSVFEVRLAWRGGSGAAFKRAC